MLSRTPQGFNHTTFSPPPVDGSLSIPELFDYNGVHSPNHPAFVYSDKSLRRTITWSHASRAVNRAASFIRQQVEQNGPHNDRSIVIAILANLDTFTSSTMIMGIIRAGYQIFPISTRHSPDSIAQLLLRTRSKFLVVGRDPASLELATSACALPSIGGVVGDFVTKLKPISWEDVHVHADTPFSRVPPHHPRPTDLALILHSSGTTSSSPKIVRITHLALLQWGMHPYYGDTDLSRHTLSAHSHPLNYAVGVVPVLWSACTGLTLAVFSPSVWSPEPNPDDVLYEAVETGCSVLLSVPSLLEGWARNPQCVDALKGFEAVLSAGAVLRKQPGDFLWNSGVRLQNFYGATEFGVVTNFRSNINDDGLNAWDYFKFSSNCIPQLVPQGGNVYHLFLMDCPTHSLNVINVECGGSHYYDTHDLLMQHPTDPTLWRLYGRTDDIIQHSSGYKTNPVPIEDIISRHHKIKACLMFGRGRRFSGLLVEPHRQFDTGDLTLLSGFIEDIWPIVDEANQASANHSKICKDMIMITSSSKPFRLTSKRTVDRDTILKEYEDDIDAHYRVVDPTSPIDSPTESPRSGLEESDSIKLARMAVEKYISEPLSDDEDLFQAGCDSLQATWIRNVICNVLHYNLKLSTRNIPYNVVYINPTIRKLGVYVAQVVRYGQASVALCTGSSRIGEMEAMVRKYGSDFSRHHVPAKPPPRRAGKREVVLLTGSTGSLGSHLLELLVKDPTVDCVYALNRRDSKGYRSVYIRQAKAFKERDLDYSILNSEKVQLVEGNLAEEGFGLEECVFEELRREVTCIIHNSWSLNFGTTLSSLEPLIAGTRRLVDFALSSEQVVPPKLVFVSTLTFLNWPSGTAVPEGPNERPSTALGTGYTESKWIAESILVKAAEQTTLQISIVRVGQLSGGPNGCWNPKEWLPSLIRSAQVVQCMPSPVGILAWMPVHLAAAAILEMRHSPHAFLNLAHPKPVPAVCVFQALADALGVPLVDYAEWLVALEASMRAGRSLTSMALLDFYRTAYRPAAGDDVETEAFGMARAETARARQAAPVMHSSMGKLGPEDVDSWVRYWWRIGLLTR